MEKKRSILILFLLLISSLAFAETVHLKSGKTVEGKMVEKTEKYIKIDVSGVPVTYYYDEIESIGEEKQDSIPEGKEIKLKITSNDPNVLVSFWEAAIKDPNSYVDKFIAYNNLGMAYVSLGKFQQAISNLEKAIQINPNYADAYSNLGNVYNSLNQYTQAMPYLQKAIEIDPGHAKAHNNLGYTYLSLEQFSEAIPHLQKSIQIDSNYADAYANLGFIYLALKKYQDAVKYFQEAIQINPEYAAAYFNLGFAYKSLGSYKESKENFQKAKELFQAQGDHQNVRLVEENLKNLPL